MSRSIAVWVTLLGMLAIPSQAQYIPMPGRYPRGRTPQMGTPRGPDSPLVDFRGTVKALTSKKLTIEIEDSNSVEFHLSKKTAFYRGDKQVKSSSVEPGASVSIEAKRAGDNSLDAVTVRVEVPKS